MAEHWFHGFSYSRLWFMDSDYFVIILLLNNVLHYLLSWLQQYVQIIVFSNFFDVDYFLVKPVLFAELLVFFDKIFSPFLVLRDARNVVILIYEQFDGFFGVQLARWRLLIFLFFTYFCEHVRVVWVIYHLETIPFQLQLTLLFCHRLRLIMIQKTKLLVQSLHFLLADW